MVSSSGDDDIYKYDTAKIGCKSDSEMFNAELWECERGGGGGERDELRDYTSVFCLVNGDNASLPCL